MIRLPVCVVIPFFNGQAFIQRALDSINAQTLGPAEVIVVDDGSLQPLDENSLSCNGGVRVIRHTVNRGIAAARNTGVRAGAQPWVTFLDQDDEWLPDRLETHYADVLRKGDAAKQMVFYGRAVRRDDAGHQLVWPRRSTEIALDRSAESALQSLVAKGNLVPFITVLFAKEAWRAAGGFDEKLRGGSDDYAMLLRLAALGFRFNAVQNRGPVARRHETGFNHSDPSRFLADDVALLNALHADIPLQPAQLERGLAAAHYRAGRGLLSAAPDAARKHLRDALRLHPFSLRIIAAAVAAHSHRRLRGLAITCWERARRWYYRPEPG